MTGWKVLQVPGAAVSLLAPSPFISRTTEVICAPCFMAVLPLLLPPPEIWALSLVLPQNHSHKTHVRVS